MLLLRLAALCFSFLLIGCESFALLESDPSPIKEREQDAAESNGEYAQTVTLDNRATSLEADDGAHAVTTRPPATSSSEPPALDRAVLHTLDTETQSAPGIRSVDSEPPNDLFARIRSGFQLDHRLDHPRVKSQAAWFKKNPAYLNRVFNRGTPYLYHIVESVETANLPLEIALLPLVESAFDPFAYSHGRASGLWQFIPGTARLYDLKIDWWFDGRRDVVYSTDAAIQYLAELNEQFSGNWPLALAAYNSGIGNVRKAIRRQSRTSDRATFWDLDLPRETEAYVPKLLAISALVQDPAAFDYELPTIPNEPVFTEVATSHQIDLDLAARLAGISVDALYQFNPGLNQWATHPEGPHRLVLPLEVADHFEDQLIALDDSSRVRWERYVIKKGDTLSHIATTFGVSTNVLIQQNNLVNDSIREGQTLLIPRPIGRQSSLSAPGRLQAKQQRLAKDPNRLEIDYLVQSGDSLWKIAKEHGTSVRQIARWNQMGEKTPLQVGQRIKLYPKKNEATADLARLPNRPSTERTIFYSVKRSDSFGRIASRFQVSISDLKTWNPDLANAKYLQPGDRVRVRVKVQNLVR